MTKEVQLAGGSATTQNQYIGPPRELTVDTSNQELRLHDGVTPGGHRFLNRDSNDSRYQAKSHELDGFNGWEPSDRGLVVRLGPANYQLRTLTVNLGNLSIDNANGYDGDPLLSLAATITTAHSWTGNHTFSGDVEFTGGLEGDLTGNVIGNLTGNVTGDVDGNLTGNAAGNHTGSFTGDVDVSGGTLTLAAGQIHLAALNQDVLDYIILNGVPIGSCIPFHKDVVDIPSNYRLCDGSNGTPDLRDRFVLCAGPNNAVDSFGGTTSHSHAVTIDAGGAHTHTGSTGGTSLTTNQLPSHFHGNGVVDAVDKLFNHGGIAASPTMGDSIDGNAASGTREGKTTAVGDGDPHSHTVTIDSGGSHAHTGSTASVGHIPPFFAKIYIMRIS